MLHTFGFQEGVFLYLEVKLLGFRPDESGALKGSLQPGHSALRQSGSLALKS